MERTVISLTTIPSRIEHIKPVIDSFYSQTVLPDHIYLWYPKTYLRGFEYREVPHFLRDYPSLSVNVCEDRLSLNRTLWVLREETDPNTLIVTADDDVVYPNNWLETFLKYHRIHPNAALGLKGRVFKDRTALNSKNVHKIFHHNITDPVKVDVLIGSRGILIKTGFFDERLYETDQIDAPYVLSDYWLSGNLARRGIKQYVIPLNERIPPLHTSAVDALKTLEHKEELNQRVIDYFQKDFINNA